MKNHIMFKLLILLFLFNCFVFSNNNENPTSTINQELKTPIENKLQNSKLKKTFIKYKYIFILIGIGVGVLVSWIFHKDKAEQVDETQKHKIYCIVQKNYGGSARTTVFFSHDVKAQFKAKGLCNNTTYRGIRGRNGNEDGANNVTKYNSMDVKAVTINNVIYLNEIYKLYPTSNNFLIYDWQYRTVHDYIICKKYKDGDILDGSIFYEDRDSAEMFRFQAITHALLLNLDILNAIF